MNASYRLYVYSAGKQSVIGSYESPDVIIESWEAFLEGVPSMAFSTKKSERFLPFSQVQLVRNGFVVFTGYIEAFRTADDRAFYSCKGLRDILESRLAAHAQNMQTVINSMNTLNQTGVTLASEPPSFSDDVTQRFTVADLLDRQGNWYLNEWEINFGDLGETGGTYRDDTLLDYDLNTETRDFYNWVQFIPQDGVNSGVYQDEESIALYGMKQLSVKLSDVVSFSPTGAAQYAAANGPRYAQLYGANRIYPETLDESVGNTITTVIEGNTEQKRILEIRVQIDENGFESIVYVLSERTERKSALQIERNRLRRAEKRLNALDGIV